MSELPGGWTIDDLARMARYIAGYHRKNRALTIDLDEATDIAAVAFVETLYADPAATSHDLYQAAHTALNTAGRREKSNAGIQKDAIGVSPHFAAYWIGREALQSPFEDTIIEKIAVKQVLDALPHRHQAVLRALAEAGTYEGAQELLGIPRTTWRMRIVRARAEARALWHWPEPPSEQWANDVLGRGDIPIGQYLADRRLKRRKALSELKETA